MRNLISRFFIFIVKLVTGLRSAQRVEELEGELKEARAMAISEMVQGEQNTTTLMSYIAQAQNLMELVRAAFNGTVQAPEAILGHREYEMFVKDESGHRMATCVVGLDLTCMVISVPRQRGQSLQGDKKISVGYGMRPETVAAGLIGQITELVAS